MSKRFFLFTLLIALVGCKSTVQDSKNANATSATNRSSNNSPFVTQKVSITSPDGVRIAGSLFESHQPNSPALLLLHQWLSDRHSYDDLALRMQAKNFNVLSIDGRGFGESTKTADGRVVAPERTGDAVKAMLGDVDAAIKFIADQPNVDKTNIFIVGASYGSSLALLYSAEHPNIAAVALLSPGLNYFGNMPTEPAIARYGYDRPLLLIAAKDDPASADAVDGLLKGLPQDNKWTMAVYNNGGHGTALLTAGAADDIEKFFAARLGPAK